MGKKKGGVEHGFLAYGRGGGCSRMGLGAGLMNRGKTYAVGRRVVAVVGTGGEGVLAFFSECVNLVKDAIVVEGGGGEDGQPEGGAQS